MPLLAHKHDYCVRNVFLHCPGFIHLPPFCLPIGHLSGNFTMKRIVYYILKLHYYKFQCYMCFICLPVIYIHMHVYVFIHTRVYKHVHVC